MTIARLHPLRLLVALATALLVIGVIAPPSNAAGTRTISISGARSGLTKASVTVSGKVAKSPLGSTVRVQRLTGKKWVKVAATKTTNASGHYSVAISLPAKAGPSSYRAVAIKKGTLPAVTSKVKVITALKKTTLTFEANPTKVALNGKTTLSGTVHPFRAGADVYIQRFLDGTWQPLNVAPISKTGTFSLAPIVPFTTTYRAVVHRSGNFAPATSPGVTVTVGSKAPPAKPVIATTSLPNGRVGEPYSFTLTAQGNPSGSWTATPLPAGLSLDAATGFVSGTPTKAATTHVVLGFTQASNSQHATTKTLDLVVDPQAAPTIITTSIPQATYLKKYSTTLTATGGGKATWTETGLPPLLGIKLNKSTGVLSGVPGAVGTYHFTVRVTNGAGTSAPVTFVLKVVR